MLLDRIPLQWSPFCKPTAQFLHFWFQLLSPPQVSPGQHPLTLPVQLTLLWCPQMGLIRIHSAPCALLSPGFPQFRAPSPMPRVILAFTFFTWQLWISQVPKSICQVPLPWVDFSISRWVTISCTFCSSCLHRDFHTDVFIWTGFPSIKVNFSLNARGCAILDSDHHFLPFLLTSPEDFAWVSSHLSYISPLSIACSSSSALLGSHNMFSNPLSAHLMWFQIPLHSSDS